MAFKSLYVKVTTFVINCQKEQNVYRCVYVCMCAYTYCRHVLVAERHAMDHGFSINLQRKSVAAFHTHSQSQLKCPILPERQNHCIINCLTFSWNFTHIKFCVFEAIFKYYFSHWPNNRPVLWLFVCVFSFKLLWLNEHWVANVWFRNELAFCDNNTISFLSKHVFHVKWALNYD